MEEKTLIQRKTKALLGGDKRAIAEAHKDLATYYYKNNRYIDALVEYTYEADIYNELNMQLDWAICNKMIGEMYMLMAEFDKALMFEKKHLDTAIRLGDLVEQQRAMSDFGRIYLLKGQVTKDIERSRESLKEAGNAFLNSLKLCLKLKNLKIIPYHEVKDMLARLVLNIGIVQDRLGLHDDALGNIEDALNICVKEELYDVLHKCYTSAASVNSKIGNHFKALQYLNRALDVTPRLENKVLKTCETLSTIAELFCNISYYKNAKQMLLKAWKLKTPDEEEFKSIESNLRVVAAMCNVEDELKLTSPSDHAKLRDLFEELGDGACYLKNYPDAVMYYLKSLDHAKYDRGNVKKLSAIYVCLYQTYKDMGRYDDALFYFEKEYELIHNVPEEAYNTLYNMAQTLYLAKKPYNQVENACINARLAAKQRYMKSLEIRILRNLLIYQMTYGETEGMEKTKHELRCLGCDNFDFLNNLDEEISWMESSEENTPRIGDSIVLEDLVEEDVEPVTNSRKPNSYIIKKNEKGETLLHLASMEGDKVLVDTLLAQGHPVDVRNGAGVQPLYAACARGHPHAARALLAAGADPNDRGGAICAGITPLYNAAQKGYLDIVQLLLGAGANPLLKSNSGNTALDALRAWGARNPLYKQKEIMLKNIYSTMENYKNAVTDAMSSGSLPNPVRSDELDTPNFSIVSQLIADIDKSEDESSDADTDNKSKNRNGAKRRTKEEKASGQKCTENNTPCGSVARKSPKTVTMSRKLTVTKENSNVSNDAAAPGTSAASDLMQPKNGMPPLNVQLMSNDDQQTKMPTDDPFVYVKVRVKGLILLMPVKYQIMDKLTVGWLVQEIKFKCKEYAGVGIKILTSHGKILSENEPLAPVINDPGLRVICSKQATTTTKGKAKLTQDKRKIINNSKIPKEAECRQGTNKPTVTTSVHGNAAIEQTPQKLLDPLAPWAPQPCESTGVAATSSGDIYDSIQQLFDEVPKESLLGRPIPNNIARNIQNILTKGLKREVKDYIMKLYSVPSNCDLLVAPTLNADLKTVLPEELVARDATLGNNQHQVGVAISALTSVIEMLSSEENITPKKCLTPLIHACRLLSDAHYTDTNVRRDLVLSSVSKTTKEVLLNTSRDTLLFGQHVSNDFFVQDFVN